MKHKHSWIKRATNRYFCKCGARKYVTAIGVLVVG